jgi:hypothetical protein
MHKDQIRRLIGKVEQKGHTLVPIQLYWKERPGEGRNRPGQGQGDRTTSATPSRTARASAKSSGP